MTADPAFTQTRLHLPALEEHLQRGEILRWASGPSAYSILRSKAALWWIGGPWLALTLVAYFTGWISRDALTPLALFGGAFLAAPFVMLFESGKTIYAITNRRALILHHGMKPHFAGVPFEKMDDRLEVLETGGGAGHVYFASHMPKRMRDTDHTGKLAFRDVARAHEVAKLLDAARGQA